MMKKSKIQRKNNAKISTQINRNDSRNTNEDIIKYLKPGNEEESKDKKKSITTSDHTVLTSFTNLKSNSNTNLTNCLPYSKENVDISPSPIQAQIFFLPEVTYTKKTSTAVIKKERKVHLRNTKVTDFFPTRRSNRRPLSDVIKEKEKLIEEALLSGVEEGFMIKEFPEKGRGIITTKCFKRGDFVLEYFGELIDLEEAKKRELIYAKSKEGIAACYMYYFKFESKNYCIDATKETGRLGRLVNHSKKDCNLKTRPFLLKNNPHLILFASRDIKAGEELLYDYGDRRKSSILAYPWLAS